MMFKSVSFNIFEENLEDIVYRDNSSAQAEKNSSPEKNIEKITERKTEIIIKPLNFQKFDRETKTNSIIS